MALYLAEGIEEGRLDYKTIFTNKHLIGLKDQTDSMLIADGKEELIVPIV